VLSFVYLRYHLCVSIKLHMSDHLWFYSEEDRHSLTLVISTLILASCDVHVSEGAAEH